MMLNMPIPKGNCLGIQNNNFKEHLCKIKDTRSGVFCYIIYLNIFLK